jgi:hypothetical protein
MMYFNIVRRRTLLVRAVLNWRSGYVVIGSDVQTACARLSNTYRKHPYDRPTRAAWLAQETSLEDQSVAASATLLFSRQAVAKADRMAAHLLSWGYLGRLLQEVSMLRADMFNTAAIIDDL